MEKRGKEGRPYKPCKIPPERKPTFDGKLGNRHNGKEGTGRKRPWRKREGEKERDLAIREFGTGDGTFSCKEKHCPKGVVLGGGTPERKSTGTEKKKKKEQRGSRLAHQTRCHVGQK